MAINPQTGLEEEDLQDPTKTTDSGVMGPATSQPNGSYAPPPGSQGTLSESGAAPAPTPTPTGTVAPPPPPPPPTPDLGGITGSLNDFTANWLKQPNAYLDPFVAATRAAGEGQLKQAEDTGKREITDWAAQRGLIGSSYEGDQRVQLSSRIDQNRREQEANLENALANYEQLGKTAAGNQAIETAKLGQSGSQFAQTLAEQQNEFASKMGLDTQQFQEAQKQFQQEYGLKVTDQLNQDAQFKATLAEKSNQDAVSNGLASRALDLQKQGLDADTAYKQASLEQTKALQTRALDLQQQGMNKEDAYKYAALSEDATFKQKTLDLQKQGMTLDNAYKEAALQQNQAQFTAELNRKLALDKTDQERFQDMLDIYAKYFKVDPKSLPNPATQHRTPDTANPDTNAGGE